MILQRMPVGSIDSVPKPPASSNPLLRKVRFFTKTLGCPCESRSGTQSSAWRSVGSCRSKWTVLPRRPRRTSTAQVFRWFPWGGTQLEHQSSRLILLFACSRWRLPPHTDRVSDQGRLETAPRTAPRRMEPLEVELAILIGATEEEDEEEEKKL